MAGLGSGLGACGPGHAAQELAQRAQLDGLDHPRAHAGRHAAFLFVAHGIGGHADDRYDGALARSALASS